MKMAGGSSSIDNVSHYRPSATERSSAPVLTGLLQPCYGDEELPEHFHEGKREVFFSDADDKISVTASVAPRAAEAPRELTTSNVDHGNDRAMSEDDDSLSSCRDGSVNDSDYKDDSGDNKSDDDLEWLDQDVDTTMVDDDNERFDSVPPTPSNSMNVLNATQTGTSFNSRVSAKEPIVPSKRYKRVLSSPTPEQRQNKRRQQKLGRAPVPKVINPANLDAADKIIKDMKDKGLPDEAVRRRLIEEGHERYDIKTVSTRYRRIQIRIKEHDDRVLEEEFSDFRAGEDDCLMKAYDTCLQNFNKKIEELENHFWKDVSQYVEAGISRAKYSTGMCRQRYEGLVDGSAVAPVEYDPDCKAREGAIAAAREQREHNRQEEALEEQRAARERREVLEKRAIAREEREDELKKAKADKAAKFAEHKARLHARKAEKEAKAKEIETMKAMQELESQRKREEKERAKQERYLKRQEQIHAKRAAKEQQKVLEKAQKLEQRKNELEETVRSAYEENERARRIRAIFEQERLAQVNTSSPRVGNKSVGKTSLGKPAEATSTDTQRIEGHQVEEKDCLSSSQISGTMNKGDARSEFTSYPTETSSDPRGSLTREKLITLLRSRNLSVSGNKKVLLGRLNDYDRQKHSEELQNDCIIRGLEKTGTRPELIFRLASSDVHEATQSPSPTGNQQEKNVDNLLQRCSTGLAKDANRRSPASKSNSKTFSFGVRKNLAAELLSSAQRDCSLPTYDKSA